MTTIEGIQEAVGSVAEATRSSVVGVTGRRSRGSGVVVAPGRVLTNAHNLWRGDDGVVVTFADGRTAQGRVAGMDPDGDIAILETDTADARPIGWNGSAEHEIGTPVFGVANPGGRGFRVTFGLVSGTQASFRGPRGRRIAGSIEHTAPLLPGSSGGPIVTGDGTMIGINTHRLGDGFYLAIPADDALRRRVDALSEGNEPKRVRLGVAVAGADVARRLRRAVGLDEVDGLLVRGVEDDGPAAKAGVKEGDVLTHAGGRELRTTDDLFDALDQAGSSVELRIVRGNDPSTVSVSLG